MHKLKNFREIEEKTHDQAMQRTLYNNGRPFFENQMFAGRSFQSNDGAGSVRGSMSKKARTSMFRPPARSKMMSGEATLTSMRGSKKSLIIPQTQELQYRKQSPRNVNTVRSRTVEPGARVPRLKGKLQHKALIMV